MQDCCYAWAWVLTGNEFMLTRLVAVLLLLFGVGSCASNKVISLPSVNQDARIKQIVVHYTRENFAESVRLLVYEGGVSSHYLIPEREDTTYRNKLLSIYQLVEENMRAWHAGLSEWQGRRGLNDQSIGIELVYVPECSDYYLNTTGLRETLALQECEFGEFDDKQIELLISLLKSIQSRYPDIHPTAIVGHSDIAPQRKTDPGPAFPWKKLYKKGIGAWYEQARVDKYTNIFEQRLPSMKLIQLALHAYGYGLLESGELDLATQNTLNAFQMHFTPEDISGTPSLITCATLFALLERYFPEESENLLLEYRAELKNTPIKNVGTASAVRN
jgi:N-acetylmuramoyl-L-alanine amidase